MEPNKKKVKERASNSIEKEQLEVLQKYLDKKGISIKEIVHEPNGMSTFPDFSIADAKGCIANVEMVAIYPDLIKDERRFEERKYGHGLKSFFDSLENDIKIWLPEDYSLVIYIDGPVIKEK